MKRGRRELVSDGVLPRWCSVCVGYAEMMGVRKQDRWALRSGTLTLRSEEIWLVRRLSCGLYALVFPKVFVELERVSVVNRWRVGRRGH